MTPTSMRFCFIPCGLRISLSLSHVFGANCNGLFCFIYLPEVIAISTDVLFVPTNYFATVSNTDKYAKYHNSIIWILAAVTLETPCIFQGHSVVNFIVVCGVRGFLTAANFVVVCGSRVSNSGGFLTAWTTGFSVQAEYPTIGCYYSSVMLVSNVDEKAQMLVRLTSSSFCLLPKTKS